MKAQLLRKSDPVELQVLPQAENHLHHPLFSIVGSSLSEVLGQFFDLGQRSAQLEDIQEKHEQVEVQLHELVCNLLPEEFQAKLHIKLKAHLIELEEVLYCCRVIGEVSEHLEESLAQLAEDIEASILADYLISQEFSPKR